jgi:hypothetical protein
VIRQSLWGVAAVFAALGTVAWLWPAGGVSASDAAAPAIVASSPVEMPAAREDAAEDIVLSNVFAANRRAPSSRYAPPELSGDSANGAMAEPMPLPMSPLDSLSMSGDVPRLYGTVIGGDGTRALLHLSNRGLALYEVGARDGGYTVVSIAPREVVVRGPGGRVTLRLDPQEDRR